MKERIYWVNAAGQLPDDEMTVLLFHPTLNEPVWLGYHFQGQWFTTSGEQLTPGSVAHWAEMPEGPKVQS